MDDGGEATVITLDVDGLRRINDSCGQQAGDDLLRSCADVVRGYVRDGDVCVRLGGDEFALLLPLAGPLVAARLESLRGRFDNATSGTGAVAASVGSASVHAGGSLADATREADAAMYSAKRSRRAGRVATSATVEAGRRKPAGASHPPDA